MLIKLATLVGAQAAIKILLNEKLPIKSSWMIQRIVRKITPELEHYGEKNLELFKKYGKEKEPKGCGEWERLPKNNTAFQDELDSILNEGIEVEIRPIPLSLLDFAPDPKYPNTKYTVHPAVLLDLDWMFYDDEGEVEEVEDKKSRKRHKNAGGKNGLDEE